MVTQREVAKRARVSVATVSRLINEKVYVSPRVRDRIQRAIRDLGYKPNLVARSLKLSKTKTLGLIFPDIENAFFISLIKKAEEVAHDNHYSVILCNTENKPEKEKMYIDVLTGRLIDGYIIIPSISNNPDAYQALRDKKVVFVDRISGLDGEICIKLDNIGAVMTAVDYLVELGHRRIGIINVPLQITPGAERFEGYKLGLKKHGIPFDDDLVRFAGFLPETGYSKTNELLSLKHRPTALLPMGGPTTIGALKAIRELGLVIPSDVSVIGIDDFTCAELLNPPLTIIAQPAYEFGTLAINMLLHIMRGKSVSQRLVELEPRLVLRESCGKPFGS
jgi:DNA-binding LacI/PurR family transcriptional regulator